MSTEDIVLVQQTICREREARDRQWWDEMRSLYGAESWVDLSWYQGSGVDFVNESMKLAKGGTTAKHQLGPVIVRVNKAGTRALATVSASIETRLTMQDGVEVDLVAQTRLLYRAIKGIDALWKLERLNCIYECDRIIPTVPGQSIRMTLDDLRPFRSSYKYLSWFLAAKGLAVNQGLPGDDRPEQVDKLYSDGFHWLKNGE
ncbi:hypothetical protein LTR84_007256 [Exophiala bonariae]|uniref:SnoaL-like domain-containing protein n=1 Tax=Exophiala bonariae TaxID=1690606 RepID=A0AAV9MYY1_9EURO|nr:hypothetical protein LTR84_007256 [Exophiala bonariae]